MSKITLSGRTIGSVKVTSTDRTTIVKSITVGTPIRSVVQAGSSFDGLSDVEISNGEMHNDFIQFDSSSQKFVNTSSPVFTTISSSLIPSADSTYDLGSAAAKWRDLYLSGSTLNLGGLAIKDQSGTFSVADSTGTAVGFDLSASQSQIRGFFSGAGDITYNSSTGEFSLDVETTYTKANFDSDFNTALDETALGGTGLTFDSASNTLSITNTGVDSAVYGSASKVPVLTINSRGQIDSAGVVNVAGVTGFSWDSATGTATITTADGNSFPAIINGFSDNQRLKFGNDNDLEIYHDGASTHIKEQGTGNLRISGSNLNLQSTLGEIYLRAINNGAVDIRYDNSIKLETTAYGATVTGTINADSATIAGNLLVNGSNNRSFIVDTTNDRLGVGTVTPERSIDLVGHAPYTADVQITQHNDNNDGGGVRFRKTRGTATAPDSAQDGDTLGGFEWYRYDGASYRQNAALVGIVDSGGSKLTFQTSVGTTSSQPRMTVQASGNVGIGTQVPSHNLQVVGSIGADSATFTNLTRVATVDSATYGSATAIPVLTVNTSGFIDSIGTIAVAGVSSTSFDSSTGIFTINTADGNSFTTHIQDSADLVRISRAALSATDAGGDGSFTYNSSTGVFTYTGPSASDTRAHFSASNGITYNSGTGDFRAAQPLDSNANPTFNQLRGPAEFIIDPAAIGNATGSVKILGDLQVEGTTTTINSTTVTLNDKNIVIGDSAADSSALNGGGITWGGSSIVNTPSLTYDHANAEFDLNRDLRVTSDIIADGDITATDLTLADTGFPRITMQDLDGTNQKGFIDASAGSFNITSQNNTSHGTINLNRYNGTSTLKSLQTTPDGSVLFYDSASSHKMKWSAPDLELQFQDDVVAEFGDGGDLRILHNGVNSKINNNTGALQITNFADNADVTISTDDGSGGSTNYFRADGSTGKTILYYYGTEKLTTESDGVTVTGSLVADSATINGGSIFFDSAGNSARLQLTHSLQQQSDVLRVQTSSGRIDIGPQNTGFAHFTTDRDKFYFGQKILAGDGAVSSYNQDLRLQRAETTKLRLTDSGATVTGSLIADSVTVTNISLPDNGIATFGSGNDFQITHNGSKTQLKALIGNLELRQQTNDGNVSILNDDGTGGVTTYLVADGSEGEVQLYHYGSQKLATKEGGATVTGSLVSDSISTGPLNLTGIVTQTVSNSDISELTGKWRYKRNPGNENLELLPNAAYTGWHPNILMRSHVTGTAMYMLTNGNRVGIGQYDAATGGTPRDMSAMITFQPSADSTPRLDIGDAGSVNGELGIGGSVILGDSLGFSTSELIQSTAAIELSGGVTYDPAGGGPDTANDVGIALTTGTRIIGADNGYIRTLLEWNQSNALEIGQSGTALINHTKIFGGTNGVELYESTAKKLETTPYGVTVTGTMNADSATISGNASAATFTSDIFRGNQYPSNSFLDFDDDQSLASNMTTLASISPMNIIFDTNNNGPDDKLRIAKGNTDIDNATVIAYFDKYGLDVTGTVNADSATISGNLTVDTNTLFVDAANNQVAIGTTSPSANAELTVTGSAGARIILEAPANTDAMLGLYGDRDWYIQNDGNATLGTADYLHIRDATAGASRMVFDTSGNVGIGTTSPTEKFEVEPDSNVSAVIGKAHIGNMGHSDYAGFSHVDQNGTGTFALMQHSSGDTYLNTASGRTINFRVSNSQKMALTGSSFDIDVPVTIGSTGSYTLDGDSAEVASVSQTSIAEFAHASYCGAKFIVTASQGTKRQISELLVTHDGTTAVATEYGTITTDSDLATYDVDISGSDVRLLATGTTATSTRYKVVETLIEA